MKNATIAIFEGKKKLYMAVALLKDVIYTRRTLSTQARSQLLRG